MCDGMAVCIIVDLSVSEGATLRATMPSVSESATKVATRAVPNTSTRTIARDNRTAEQMVVLDEVLKLLHEVYPEARIVGHCELNHGKACPCLDPPASKEYKYIFNA